MLDGFHILTLTHRHVALDEIGNALVRADDEAAVFEKLHDLKSALGWEELLYLATCNRVLYFFYAPQPLSADFRPDFLGLLRPDLPSNKIVSLASRMELLNGADAIRHLLEVAASMDSLVVGEREILRQLREAYERCRQAGLTGDHIRLAMRHTVEVAKEIYTATGIGEKPVSVVSLAFGEMMKSQLPTDARILMIGAGQTNELFSKFLAKQGFRCVTVFNRSFEKAEKVAASLGGRALPWSALEHFSEGFDALIVCTGAQYAVVTPELYKHLLAGENTRKVVVDLSIPHNVDRQVVSDFSVRYIEIEGLRDIARENLAHRSRERAKADEILVERVLAFRDMWHERQVERSMAHIPAEVQAVKEKAIREVFKKDFDALDPQARETVLKMLEYMERKCVAIPIKAAKEIALRHRKTATLRGATAAHA